MNVDNHQVTPSEMVLLNGAQFASAAGWLGSKVELFDGETKVSGQELGQAMLAAAFLANEQAEATRREISQKKMFFGLFTSTTLRVESATGPTEWPTPSLEAYIQSRVGRDGQEVFQVVVDWLRQDSNDPWSEVAGLIKENLAQRGVLEVVTETKMKVFTSRRYVLPEETAAQISQYPLEPVQHLLTTAKQTQAEVWQQLTKQIDKAISRRTKRENNGGGDFGGE